MPDDSLTNPLSSKIKDIILKKQNTEDLNYSVINQNLVCRFAKIEFIESIYEAFPQGSLVVKDTSDVITFIKINELDVVQVHYVDNTIKNYYITSTSYINNAVSESEENYVSIGFSNFIFKFNKDNSLTQIMGFRKPIVQRLSSLINTIYNKIFQRFIIENYDCPKPQLYGLIDTFNYGVYMPVNPTEYRQELPVNDTIQYLNYLASYACEINFRTPRCFFWTGFNNELNFKFFFNNINQDPIGNDRLDQYNFRYAVYNSDEPGLNLVEDSFPYKKIYSLITNPAEQQISKKYFYVRKVPKILDNYTKLKTTLENIQEYREHTLKLLPYQFQDEGEKYNNQIIFSDGSVRDAPITLPEGNIVRPNRLIPGSQEMIYPKHWGYYDSLNPLDYVSTPTHINQVYGNNESYNNQSFYGITDAMPYVDTTDMWKNVFDITPVHPNLPFGFGEATGQNIQLQALFDLRYRVFENSRESKQLEKSREIERQNFISYVLCCLKEQKEESFFAAILGYQAESDPYYQRGVNGESLKYKYYWAKLKLIEDPRAIPEDFSALSIKGNPFRAFESQLWQYDIGTPAIFPGGVPNGEWSGLGDYTEKLAVNLNERTNWYNAIGLTYTGFTAFPFPGWGSTGSTGGYYAPGWHAKSVKDENFTKIKYRAISQDINDYIERVDPTLIDYPPFPDLGTGGDQNLNRQFKRRHITRMYKTPIVKLLLESGITDCYLLNAYDGRYIYWFDAQNVMDGPCE